MSTLPSITAAGRGRGIARIAACALGQAAAAAVAAFATRDVFVAFRDNADTLPLTALALIGLSGVAIGVLRYAERVVAERVGQNYAAALRAKLFRHLTKLSARAVAKRRAGGLSMRFVGDLAAVRGWVSLGLARLISASIVLPCACLVLFLLDPALGAAASIPIGIGLAAMVIAAPRLGPAHKRLRARRAKLAADMSERIPHAPELRLLGRIQTEMQHLARRTDALVDSALIRARGAALLRSIPDAVAGVAAGSLFLAALVSGNSGAEAAGALAAVALMIQPMRDLAGVWDRHRGWVAARDKCEALLAVPPLERPARSSDDALADQPHALLYEKVSTPVLRGVDIEAAPGRKIAVIGGNGAGKSSLLSLAAGLEQPVEGSVTFGGAPPESLNASERRRMVSFVGSRSPILAGSLRRALVMGAEERPEDDAILAEAEAFGLSDAIERLGGLDGRVTEGGRNLSAGEVRRLLLTRAALSKPSLMLLDEPDDTLDAAGPSLVNRLVRGVDATTLLITHNLAIARAMDEIWYLEGGKLLETGSPDEVLNGNGPAAGFLKLRAAA